MSVRTQELLGPGLENGASWIRYTRASRDYVETASRAPGRRYKQRQTELWLAVLPRLAGLPGQGDQEAEVSRKLQSQT